MSLVKPKKIPKIIMQNHLKKKKKNLHEFLENANMHSKKVQVVMYGMVEKQEHEI